MKTGAVNTHIATGPAAPAASSVAAPATPPVASPAGPAVQPATAALAVPAAPPPIPATVRPAGAHAASTERTYTPASPSEDRLFGVTIRQNEDAKLGIGADAVRGLQFLSAALAGFFVLVALITLYAEHADHTKAQREAALQSVAERADVLDATLAAAVLWTNTAISSGSSPERIVNVAARGKDVAAAAVIGADGRALAAIPNTVGDVLAPAAAAQSTGSGVHITSVIAENGDINPVIVRDAPNGKLVVALAPETLASAGGSTLMISPTGRLISAPPAIARSGLSNALGLSPQRVTRITQGASARLSEKATVGSRDVWLASARIPNSDLTVMDTAPRTRSPRMLRIILNSLCLFGGTCAVIWAMMRRLLNQLRSAQTGFAEDEITRQRYQAALEGSGGGVFEIDLKDNTVFLSSALVEALNMGTDERYMTLAEFLAILDDGSRETFYSTLRRAHMTGTFACDARVRHLPLILECKGRPIMRSETEGALATRKVLVGVAHDVSDARGADARLRAAEARLYDALRSTSDAFVVWDKYDRLVLWNAQYEGFFGFTPGNLQVGMDRATIDYHASTAIRDRRAMDGDAKATEIELADGRFLRWLENSTEDGGRVTVASDVSEIRYREEELRRNQDVLESNVSTLQSMQGQLLELAQSYEQEKIRAEEANQSKSEFLANMSHELRTPLNAINGFSDIMQKEMFGPLGDPRYREYVNDILFSGKHLLSLINDILDMSKIEAGKMTLNIDRFSITDTIESVIRIVRGRAEENRLKLLFTPVQTQALEADPRAVKQILLNLISNAIKFTPEGGVVRVTCEPKSAGVVVRVSDSGMGISEDDLIRLAQPFEQASNNKSGEGTGLGLALSKSLVELHGGNFHIASKLGEGTTITFTLPNRPTPQKANAAPKTGVSEEISRIASTISSALEQGRDAAQTVLQAPAQPPAPQPPAPQSPAPQSPAPQSPGPTPASTVQPYVPPAA